jgi:tellurite resistance protein TerC
MESIYGWIGFLVFVLLMLALDLGVFNRKTHVISIKEALIWSGVWIMLAMAFNVLIYMNLGHEKAFQFFTGYVIEKALSVDNLFVFILVFGYFHVQLQYQHKILFWGVLGALVMRAMFIGAGVALIHSFSWIMYVFGVFLIYTGFKMMFTEDKEIEPDKNPVVKLFKRYFPVTEQRHGSAFFIKQAGKYVATPLFIVLIVVEVTDLIFAVDSIPAILAITDDPYIVFTSNVFAILGLRSLYFALAGLMQYFSYLKYGLALILAFVGAKMCISHYFEPREVISIQVSLLVILGILSLSIIASLLFKQKEEKHAKH